MVIRFNCQHCGQLLGIASRKAGAEIACLRCGFRQVVPGEAVEETVAPTCKLAETEEAAAANPQADESPPASGFPGTDDVAPATPQAENTETDEVIPANLQAEDTTSASADSDDIPDPFSETDVPDVAGEQPEPAPAYRRPPPDMILFPRRVIYIQAALFLVLAFGALAAGYFVGRGSAAGGKATEAEARAQRQVPFEGRVVCSLPGDKAVADEGTVVIALPEGKYPAKRLVAYGIGPTHPQPRDEDSTLVGLRALGGAYARVEASGQFMFYVPDKGTYRILVISRRARQENDVEVPPSVKAELEKYFDRAEALLGSSQWRWEQREITLDSSAIQVEFR